MRATRLTEVTLSNSNGEIDGIHTAWYWREHRVINQQQQGRNKWWFVVEPQCSAKIVVVLIAIGSGLVTGNSRHEMGQTTDQGNWIILYGKCQ